MNDSIFIETPYITLQDALKLAGIVGTGGQAKMLILDELVSVNGEICTMRGKKLRENDVFEFEDMTIEVKRK